MMVASATSKLTELTVSNVEDGSQLIKNIRLVATQTEKCFPGYMLPQFFIGFRLSKLRSCEIYLSFEVVKYIYDLFSQAI